MNWWERMFGRRDQGEQGRRYNTPEENNLKSEIASLQVKIEKLERTQTIVVSSPDLPYTATATRRFLEEFSIGLIHDVAAKMKIDALLVRAVAEKESNLHPFAVRVELHLKKQRWFRIAMAQAEQDVNNTWNTASYGLIQILYATALDYVPNPKVVFALDLMDPKISLEYGILHLRRQLERYSDDVPKALSAYNAGHATSKNKVAYVKPIMERWAELKG